MLKQLKKDKRKAQFIVVFSTLGFTLGGIAFAVSLLVFFGTIYTAISMGSSKPIPTIIGAFFVIIISGALSRKLFPIVLDSQNKDEQIQSDMIDVREKKDAQAGAISMSVDDGVMGGLTDVSQSGQVSQVDETSRG